MQFLTMELTDGLVELLDKLALQGRKKPTDPPLARGPLVEKLLRDHKDLRALGSKDLPPRTTRGRPKKVVE